MTFTDKILGDLLVTTIIITGPPTHSVGGRPVMISGVCRRLSASSVVCNTAHMQRNSPGDSTWRASRVTCHQGDTLFHL